MKKNQDRKEILNRYRSYIGIVKDETPSALLPPARDVGINNNVVTAGKALGFFSRISGKYHAIAKPTIKNAETLLEEANRISYKKKKGWFGF